MTPTCFKRRCRCLGVEEHAAVYLGTRSVTHRTPQGGGLGSETQSRPPVNGYVLGHRVPTPSPHPQRTVRTLPCSHRGSWAEGVPECHRLSHSTSTSRDFQTGRFSCDSSGLGWQRPSRWPCPVQQAGVLVRVRWQCPRSMSSRGRSLVCRAGGPGVLCSRQMLHPRCPLRPAGPPGSLQGACV